MSTGLGTSGRSTGVVTATILSAGRAIDPGTLVSLDVIREVNRIPEARLVLLDGDSAEQDFPLSDGPAFEPGREVEIRLRYEGSRDDTVFKGLVVRHGVEADQGGTSLNVELKDAAVKLTLARKGAVFRQQADSDVIGKILRDAGLKAGRIAATKPIHPEIVQYDCTDWDFLLSRADALGLVVVVSDGEVSLFDTGAQGPPTHALRWGIDEIYDFEILADATHQFGALQGVAWDVKNQRQAVRKARPFGKTQGNLDGTRLARAIGFGPATLLHPAPLDPSELQAWADARMARSRLAMVRGRISVAGSATFRPMDVLKLSGVGARFNGNALITGVRHRLDDHGWRTDVQLGLSPDPFSTRDDIVAPPSAGLLPAAVGLQVGVIDRFQEDPYKAYRVRVLLPSVGEKAAVWARLASPDAGEGRGYFFRPEPGDEVVVGFLNGDPRQAIVLGALFGPKNAPPKGVSPLAEKNVHKAIVTRKGTTIGFVDEDKPSVFIETAGKNKILIDDQDQAVKITDQHGNSITMDKGGIAIKSAKDVKIEASGNVEIKGSKVDVK